MLFALGLIKSKSFSRIGVLVLAVIFLAGCSTLSEKERLLKKGTFVEKIAYLDKNYSTKDEVVEFLGPPEKVKNFYGYSSIWLYENSTEQPIEIVFGSDGRIMRIELKSSSKY